MARSEVLGLYRRVLRLHQRLPGDLGTVGRKFVQEEFKSHQKASAEHATLFIKEWTSFADTLSTQLVSAENKNKTVALGKGFSKKDLDLLNEQQLIQLFELSKEAKKHKT